MKSRAIMLYLTYNVRTNDLEHRRGSAISLSFSHERGGGFSLSLAGAVHPGSSATKLSVPPPPPTTADPRLTPNRARRGPKGPVWDTVKSTFSKDSLCYSKIEILNREKRCWTDCGEHVSTPQNSRVNRLGF